METHYFPVCLLVCFAGLTFGHRTAFLERQTRCLARCMDYHPMSGGAYSCKSSACLDCVMTCFNMSSLSQCLSDCKSMSCRLSCYFINNMAPSTTDKSMLPHRPPRPKLVGGKLQWDSEKFIFYKKKIRKKYGVIFLLLVSKAPVSFGVDTDSNLSWEFAFHTPHQSALMSHVSRDTTLECGERYVFKVAAFNQFGSRGYTRISNPYTTKNLLNKACSDWYPYSALPPSQCSRFSSTKYTQVNLQLYNTQEDQSHYIWNGNCLNLKASLRVLWSHPQSIPKNFKFCYEFFLMPGAHNPGCKMESRMYYLPSNTTEIVLKDLQPGCTLFATLYAGHVGQIPQTVNIEMELDIKVPRTLDRCVLSSPPSSPKITTVTPSTHSAVIHWLKPSYVDSNYPILGYVVAWGQSLASNSSRTIDLSNSSTYTTFVQPKLQNRYRVDHLLPNHRYYCQICAVSGAGNSSFTRPRQFYTEDIYDYGGNRVTTSMDSQHANSSVVLNAAHLHPGQLRVMSQVKTNGCLVNVAITLSTAHSSVTSNPVMEVECYNLTWGYGKRSTPLVGYASTQIGDKIKLNTNESADGQFSRMFLGLLPDTDYWFKVFAVTKFGLDVWSTELTVRTIDFHVPDAPKDVSVALSYSSDGYHFTAMVSWDNPESKDNVDPLLASFIQWGTGNASAETSVFGTVKVGPTATHYEISDLPLVESSGQLDYWLEVWSLNERGNGTKSHSVLFAGLPLQQWPEVKTENTTVVVKTLGQNSDIGVILSSWMVCGCWTIYITAYGIG